MLELQNNVFESEVFSSEEFSTPLSPQMESGSAFGAGNIKIGDEGHVVEDQTGSFQNNNSNKENVYLVTIPPINRKEMIKHVFHVIRVYKIQHNQEFTEAQMKTVFDALCLKSFRELTEYAVLFDSGHPDKSQQEHVKKVFRKRLVEANFKNSYAKIQQWSKCYERPRRDASAKAFKALRPKKMMSVGFSNANTIYVF